MSTGWINPGGGAGITLLTSADSSVVIANPAGPTSDFSVTPASVGALPNSGGTMSGDIDMGGFSVVNATFDKATTAISTTTAIMGLAHDYEATAAPITITVSTADFTEGREFLFRARTAAATGGTPITIATEGGQLIDGAASIVLTFDWDKRTFLVRNGNLVSA